MIWLTLSQVADMVGGELYGNDADIEAVFIDSRKVKPDQLFIAIKGERFDAHDFVAELEGKAAGALVHQLIDCNLPQIVVKDTHQALGDFAKAWRETRSIPVIGLTGSNGKTTVKEMLASILSEQGKVLATLGNLNNDIGMPLTLLNIRDEHDYAVIEMGANHFGEIGYLTHIAQPDVAIVNNAGAAHLEGFGDIKGVSRAKGEIFAGLKNSGVAVINADDQYADYWKEECCADNWIVSFGMEQPADVHGELADNGDLLIHLGDQEPLSVTLKLLGKHNAMNALAATAASMVVGATEASIKAGLEKLNPVKGRLAPVKAKQQALVIDDTYNANPSSVQMGIKVLARYQGKRILVLGDMAELGENVAEMHANIGLFAKDAGIDALFALGENSQPACKAFGEKAKHFDRAEQLIETLEKTIDNNTTILIKGSRAMKMERIVQALSTEENS